MWGNPARYQEITQNSINLRKDDMRRLQVLQNSTMRILMRKKYDTQTSTLLAESKTLSVNQTVAMSILNQVFKNSCQPAYHYKRLFGRLIDENQRTDLEKPKKFTQTKFLLRKNVHKNSMIHDIFLKLTLV